MTTPFRTLTITLVLADVDGVIDAFQREKIAAIQVGDQARVHECETVIAAFSNVRRHWTEQEAA